MATHKLLLLPGDGIGPEVMAQVEQIVSWFGKQGLASFEIEKGLVGGAAYDAHKQAISEGDMKLAQQADAVLFGAVGGPKWADVPYQHRPEAGLLRLRKDLGLFANLRPAVCYPALADASSLKREVVEGAASDPAWREEVVAQLAEEHGGLGSMDDLPPVVAREMKELERRLPTALN